MTIPSLACHWCGKPWETQQETISVFWTMIGWYQPRSFWFAVLSPSLGKPRIAICPPAISWPLPVPRAMRENTTGPLGDIWRHGDGCHKMLWWMCFFQHIMGICIRIHDLSATICWFTLIFVYGCVQKWMDPPLMAILIGNFIFKTCKSLGISGNLFVRTNLRADPSHPKTNMKWDCFVE